MSLPNIIYYTKWCGVVLAQLHRHKNKNWKAKRYQKLKYRTLRIFVSSNKCFRNADDRHVTSIVQCFFILFLHRTYHLSIHFGGSLCVCVFTPQRHFQNYFSVYLKSKSRNSSIHDKIERYSFYAFRYFICVHYPKSRFFVLGCKLHGAAI